MLDATEGHTTADGRKIGPVVMEMKNITLRFGGVVAIENISFDIREGEIRAIIGPNGAGKSSMLNVVSGFYTPQEGEVWFRGQPRPPMKIQGVSDAGPARAAVGAQVHALRSGVDSQRSVTSRCPSHDPATLAASRSRVSVRQLVAATVSSIVSAAPRRTMRPVQR